MKLLHEGSSVDELINERLVELPAILDSFSQVSQYHKHSYSKWGQSRSCMQFQIKTKTGGHLASI